MNLVTRFLAARRDRLLMRLGCWLVCFSLVLGLMFPQQKAEALAAELTITAVASVAAAYLGACGLSFVTQGMDKDALVSSVQRLIQEFLDTELGGISIQDWLGSVWNVLVIAGKLIMGRPLTNEFMGFAQWVAEKYAAQVGTNVVYSDKTITSDDGTIFILAVGLGNGTLSPASTGLFYSQYSLGTNITPFVSGHSKDNRYQVSFGGQSFSFFEDENGKFSFGTGPYYLTNSSVNMFYLSSDGCLGLAYIYQNNLSSEYFGNLFCSFSPSLVIPDSLILGSDLSIDRAPSMSYIPDGITAEQGIALDVGAEAAMDLELVLKGVLDDVLAGTLTSTMEGVETEVVDPPAEELPDVGELGLPALGEALTSRFPFSIPWDFFRAVQLLAAPAKAPYFEVDFMEPLADEVGGWKGSTTVILDFSEYAIIGQISRWTSTIGFCLMLAGATKRLIWTA